MSAEHTLVTLARERLSGLPMAELAAAGYARNRSRYYLNISYPSLQAMGAVGPESGLFHTSFPATRPLPPAAIYVHVPFCTALCYYCHFYKEYRKPPAAVDDFLDALTCELEVITARFGTITAKSVFIGGGTPSYLLPDQIVRLFDVLTEHIEISPGAEITFEMHPESTDSPRLESLNAVGVNRINLGVESLVDEVLALENRRHNVADVYDAVQRIETHGFCSLNLDLIYGLRDQHVAEWATSLRRVAELAPPSVTLYYLRIKRQTPEMAALRRGRSRFPSEDDLLLMHVMNCVQMEDQLDYRQRPVDWFIRSDTYAHQYQDHNWLMADEVPLVGLGPSAYSYIDGWQFYNVNDLTRYTEAVRGGQPAWWRGEHLEGDEPIRRSLTLGLKNGLDRQWFRNIHDADPVEHFSTEFQLLENLGLVEINSERVDLSYTGRLLADEVGHTFYSAAIAKRMNDVEDDLISTTWQSLNP